MAPVKPPLFDLLMGFYKPQEGTITVDGVDLSEISVSSRCSKIAKISQDTFLFPGTIRENLLLANPNATDDQLDIILQKVCLTDFLSHLPNGLDTDIGENGLLLPVEKDKSWAWHKGYCATAKLSYWTR